MNHSWEKYTQKLQARHADAMKKKDAQLALSEQSCRRAEKRLDEKFREYDQTLFHAKDMEKQHKVSQKVLVYTFRYQQLVQTWPKSIISIKCRVNLKASSCVHVLLRNNWSENLNSKFASSSSCLRPGYVFFYSNYTDDCLKINKKTRTNYKKGDH